MFSPYAFTLQLSYACQMAAAQWSDEDTNKLGSKEETGMKRPTFLRKLEISHHKEENDLETQGPVPTSVVTHRTISSPRGGKGVCVAITAKAPKVSVQSLH